MDIEVERLKEYITNKGKQDKWQKEDGTRLTDVGLVEEIGLDAVVSYCSMINQDMEKDIQDTVDKIIADAINDLQDTFPGISRQARFIRRYTRPQLKEIVVGKRLYLENAITEPVTRAVRKSIEIYCLPRKHVNELYEEGLKVFDEIREDTPKVKSFPVFIHDAYRDNYGIGYAIGVLGVIESLLRQKKLPDYMTDGRWILPLMEGHTANDETAGNRIEEIVLDILQENNRIHSYPAIADYLPAQQAARPDVPATFCS